MTSNERPARMSVGLLDLKICKLENMQGKKKNLNNPTPKMYQQPQEQMKLIWN